MRKVWTVTLVFLMVLLTAGNVLAYSGDNDTQRLAALVAKSLDYPGLEMTGDVTAFGFPANVKILQAGGKTKLVAETMGIIGFVVNDGVDSYFWVDFDPMVQVIRGGSIAQTFGADFNDPQNVVTYVARETVNGFECERYTIKVGAKNITVYISTKYGVPIKTLGKDMDVNIKSITEKTIEESEFNLPVVTRYYEVRSFGI